MILYGLALYGEMHHSSAALFLNDFLSSMLMMPPKPKAGKNRIIRSTSAFVKMALMCFTLSEKATPGLLQRSSAIRWMGVATTCTIRGLVSWATRYPLAYERLVLLLISLPRMGGMVKAEAMAMMSLVKKRLQEMRGKGRVEAWPNLTAYFLSLMRLVVVLARKTMNSFWMECGMSGVRLTWSARLETEQVEKQTKYIHRKEKPVKKDNGDLKIVSRFSPASFHSPPLPLVYSITDLSTTTLSGDTLKPEQAPAKTSASRIFQLGVYLFVSECILSRILIQSQQQKFRQQNYPHSRLNHKLHSSNILFLSLKQKCPIFLFGLSGSYWKAQFQDSYYQRHILVIF